MTRIYGSWAGRPNGVKENPEQCIETVYGGSYISHQCYRKRGHGPDGLYCKQHGNMAQKRMERDE